MSNCIEWSSDDECTQSDVEQALELISHQLFVTIFHSFGIHLTNKVFLWQTWNLNISQLHGIKFFSTEKELWIFTSASTLNWNQQKCRTRNWFFSSTTHHWDWAQIKSFSDGRGSERWKVRSCNRNEMWTRKVEKLQITHRNETTTLCTKLHKIWASLMISTGKPTTQLSRSLASIHLLKISETSWKTAWGFSSLFRVQSFATAARLRAHSSRSHSIWYFTQKTRR